MTEKLRAVSGDWTHDHDRMLAEVVVDASMEMEAMVARLRAKMVRIRENVQGRYRYVRLDSEHVREHNTAPLGDATFWEPGTCDQFVWEENQQLRAILRRLLTGPGEYLAPVHFRGIENPWPPSRDTLGSMYITHGDYWDAKAMLGAFANEEPVREDRKLLRRDGTEKRP